MVTRVLVPRGYRAWVAAIDPPLFLNSLTEFSAEGGRNGRS